MSSDSFQSSCCNLIKNSFAPEVFILCISLFPKGSSASNLCIIYIPTLCFVLLQPLFSYIDLPVLRLSFTCLHFYYSPHLGM
nr:MAG TPA: hypothetical protein [Caudoviricetes sp.]